MHGIVRFTVLFAAVEGESYNGSEEHDGTDNDSGDTTSGDTCVFVVRANTGGLVTSVPCAVIVSLRALVSRCIYSIALGANRISANFGVTFVGGSAGNGAASSSVGRKAHLICRAEDLGFDQGSGRHSTGGQSAVVSGGGVAGVAVGHGSGAIRGSYCVNSCS